MDGVMLPDGVGVSGGIELPAGAGGRGSIGP